VYVVASGISTILGVQPNVFGSPNVVKLLAADLDGVVGARFRGRARPRESGGLDPPPHRGQAQGSRAAGHRPDSIR